MEWNIVFPIHQPGEFSFLGINYEFFEYLFHCFILSYKDKYITK